MKLLVCLFLSTIFSAYAQDIDLGGIKITQEQLKAIAAQLPKTDKERYFFHWTNRATGMRWVSQGHVNSGEVNFFNTPTGDRQVYGPGIYLAEKPTSSKHFGEVPIGFTIEKGTPLYDAEVIKKVIGKELTAAQASELGEHIPLIRHAANDWFVTNHSDNTDILRYGNKFSPEAKVYVNNPTNWTQFRLSPDFKELVQRGDQDAIYLKNVLDASDYMDGISFARAMKVNPGAPWNEFEPENFGKYQKALDEISPKANDLKARGFGKLEQNLLEVQTTFTGRKDITDLKATFRMEGIRAGGDEAGKTFLASAEQLKNMQANPYLEVASVPQGENFLVHYFYPDALHFKKLKGKIPDDLFNRLEGAQDLMNNHDLRRSLNKELISALIDDFAKNMQKGTGNWKDLISIHPFEDMNGRTVRMMQEIYESGANHFILGDIDILLPLEQQKMYWARSAKAHQGLQVEFIDEFLKAKSEHRMPDYLKTTGLKDYVNRAFPTPMSINLNDQKTLEMIRNRQWLTLVQEGKNGGIKELSLSLKDPAKFAQGVQELLDVTDPALNGAYSPEDMKAFATMIENVLKKRDGIPGDAFDLYTTYIDFYNRLPVDVQKAFPTPARMKLETLESLKQAMRTMKETDAFTYQNVFMMPKYGIDKTLNFNYSLGMVNPKNNLQGTQLVDNMLQNTLRDMDRMDFTKLKPADQKRTLISVKSYVEKMIEVKNKSSAEFGMSYYKKFYNGADINIKAVMPTADKLRSWTKKGGFHPCSLTELLLKMTP